MHSTIGIRDRIGKALNLLRIRIRVLENRVDKGYLGLIVDQNFAHSGNSDRLRVNELLRFTEFPDKLRNAPFEEENLSSLGITSLIS